jgi:hypothetical protein
VVWAADEVAVGLVVAGVRVVPDDVDDVPEVEEPVEPAVVVEADAVVVPEVAAFEVAAVAWVEVVECAAASTAKTATPASEPADIQPVAIRVRRMRASRREEEVMSVIFPAQPERSLGDGQGCPRKFLRVPWEAGVGLGAILTWAEARGQAGRATLTFGCWRAISHSVQVAAGMGRARK